MACMRYALLRGSHRTSPAGHLVCLERLEREGRLLSSNVDRVRRPGRRGEVSSGMQPLTACNEGRAHVLAWLFRAGWPAFRCPPRMLDSGTCVAPPDTDRCHGLVILGMQYGGGWLIQQ